MTEAERQIIGERDYKIAEVRANQDLTEEAKQRRIDELNQWAGQEITAEREFAQRKIEEEVTSSRRALYGIPEADGAKSAGEREQIYQSWRSARADVFLSTLDPSDAPDELQGILDEAERTGDTLLARAAYHRGLDLGLQPTIDKYLADKPEEAKRLQRYNSALEAEQQANSFESLLNAGMALSND
jgi:hypothetical protein